MFIHQQQLVHLLEPSQYTSPEQFETEIERLFRPVWHFVGTLGDLPKHGDFLTLELFGQPLVVRNFEGEIRAFLNVCAHRHCPLTSAPRGNQPEFKCQYHGWEYNPDGRTARIPDARSFRPFDRENSRLQSFRTETCGDLIFVSLADDGPALEDFLGVNYELLRRSFSPPYAQVWSFELDYQANWKVPVENALESYHIPCVHAKTFGSYPDEAEVVHELDPQFTAFRTQNRETAVVRLQRRVIRRLGGQPDNDYLHLHVHPQLMLTKTDALYRMLQVVVPTSPTTAHSAVRLYQLRGERPGLYQRLLFRLFARVGAAVSRRILMEDYGIISSVQQGLAASPHPGVIGRREERIHVFQKYVRDRCGAASRQVSQTRIGARGKTG